MSDETRREGASDVCRAERRCAGRCGECRNCPGSDAAGRCSGHGQPRGSCPCGREGEESGSPVVAVVSSSPILTAAVRHCLASGPEPFACRVGECADPAALRADPAADALVLIPQDWREMAEWLPGLRERASGSPWLLLADARLAGVLWSAIEPRLCTVVTPAASPEDLRAALSRLLQRQALCPPAALLDLFAAHLPPARGGTANTPTPRELQCGCAAALRLSNARIAGLLCVTEGTVKGHLYALMRKLGVGDRGELEERFQRAVVAARGSPAAGR